MLSPLSIFAQESMVHIIPPPNPSAAYCEELGYKITIKKTPEGELGICNFSDTEQAPAWSFLRGEEAQEHSYCAKVGYEMKLIDDPAKCGATYKPGHGCLACILEDGSEVEAGNLLKIEKARRLTNPCNNDGKCLTPETPQNCPQDCTVAKQEIPKDNAKNIVLAIMAISGIIVIILTSYYFLRKKENNDI